MPLNDEDEASKPPAAKPPSDESRERWEAAKASAIGIHFVVSLAVGAGLGWWLDGRFDTYPLCTAIGFAIGLVSAFRELYLIGKRHSESDDT